MMNFEEFKMGVGGALLGRALGLSMQDFNSFAAFRNWFQRWENESGNADLRVAQLKKSCGEISSGEISVILAALCSLGFACVADEIGNGKALAKLLYASGEHRRACLYLLSEH